MDYRDAIRWIIDRSGYDKGFVANPFAGDDAGALGLRRTAGLLRRVGNPQRAYRIAHVAGTKGKGSTSATIATLARAAGRTTGLYATPHLHTFRERIMLGEQPIAEGEFATVAELVATADASLRAEEPELGEPTAFEVATAMALLAFVRAGVDLAVVEVGLGGRLDATNVIAPDVSVITAISYDHTAILGDTLAAIAAEKGGIIKPRTPVVVAPQPDEALEMLKRLAVERGAPLYAAGGVWDVGYDGGRARLSGPWGNWNELALALRGAHQAENTGAALMACWLLDPAWLADEAAVRAALAAVRWPGRFERVAAAPEIYVDGAHNVDSMTRLVATLLETGVRDLTVVLGVGRDKDLPGMIGALTPLRPRVIATASRNPRAAAPERVAEAARATGLSADTAPSIAAALELARATANPASVICVTGSLYAVAEAREALGLATTPVFERELLYG